MVDKRSNMIPTDTSFILYSTLLLKDTICEITLKTNELSIPELELES